MPSIATSTPAGGAGGSVTSTVSKFSPLFEATPTLPAPSLAWTNSLTSLTPGVNVSEPTQRPGVAGSSASSTPIHSIVPAPGFSATRTSTRSTPEPGSTSLPVSATWAEIVSSPSIEYDSTALITGAVKSPTLGSA